MTTWDRPSWRAAPWSAAAFVVALDQVTKELALSRLADGPFDVVGSLRFRLTFNSGMAFGAGAGWGPVIGGLAIAVIVYLVRMIRRHAPGPTTVALGILIGGAAGNLIDRLARGDAWLRGSVVDFIDLGWFPVFNIADAAINIGAALLVLAIWFESRRGAAPGATDRSEDDDSGTDGAAT
jgi:signal peptidase II